MQLGTSGLQGKGIKRSVLGVRRLKIKTTRGQNRSQHSLPARFLQNYANQTRRAHITVTVRCVTTSRMQKVNGSRSHKDVDRFGGVAEGSFSTTVGYSSFSALALCGRQIACHGTSATSVGHFPPRTYSHQTLPRRNNTPPFSHSVGHSPYHHHHVPIYIKRSTTT